MRVLVLVFAITAWGCSSNATGGVGFVEESTFCTRFAAALCDSAIPCCSRRGQTVDGDTCRRMAESECSEYAPRHHPERYAFDGARAARCLDFMPRIGSCTLRSSDSALDFLDDDCEDAWSGIVQAGGACDSPKECADEDSWCSTSPPAADGVCVRPTLSAAGASCAQNSISPRCAPDLFCDAASSVCVARIPRGGACDPEAVNVCAEDLVCSEATKVCASRPALGEPCTGPCAPPAICTSAPSGGSVCAEPPRGDLFPDAELCGFLSGMPPKSS